MRATIVEIQRKTGTRVRLFTIRANDEGPTEFQDFISRMSKKCPKQLGELLTLIDQIQTRFGAQEHLFRHERNSHALPNRYYSAKFLCHEDEENTKFGLRLYCLRIGSYALLLYNGDLKTAQNPEDCPNVSQHFKFALRATTVIDRAILEGDIEFGEAEGLLIADDFSLEI